jgi:ankyrin repeat protein
MVVARTGKVDAAKALLIAGAKVNAIESFGGQSALMWSAAECQPAMIRMLLEYGAKVNARSTVRDWQARITAEPRPKDRHMGGFTPLLYVAREGDVESAKALLDGGADINMYTRDRETPLVLALENQHFDLAKYLISAGADIDKWDLYGRSPLYTAVDLSTLPTGGRPDTPSSDKTTALELMQMLLDKGANPNLQLKLRPPYRNVVFDRGGDQVLSTGATPLLRASKAGDNPAAMKLLLEHGALVDLSTADGVTPLMIAAGMGHGSNPTRGRYQTDDDAVEALKILIKAGADINRHAANGQTAMHAAALKGWNGTIRFLAENGAQLEAKDRDGKTPLDFANGNYHPPFGGGVNAPTVSFPETAKLLKDLIAKPAIAKP